MANKIITTILIILLIIASIIISWKVINPPKDIINEIPIENNSHFIEGDLGLNPELLNQTPRITILCKPLSDNKENREVMPYISWIYSQCAIVEANENLNLYDYDLMFKKYHVCFIIENKSIGDCI